MKNIYDTIFSLKLTATLFIFIALACAVATFVENDFGTQTAKILIYNALWFELIIAIFALNLTGNIFRFKMYKKQKRSLLIFHASLLFIIFGAAITRYAGYEGIMHIRESEASNIITSSDTFVQAKVYQDGKSKEASQKVSFTQITKNDYKITIPTPKGDVKIEYAGFFQNGAEVVQEDVNGIPYINIFASSDGNPKEFDLFYGGYMHLDGLTIYFGKNRSGHKKSIFIDYKDGKLVSMATHDLKWMSMNDNSSGVYEKNKNIVLSKRHLYSLGDIQLVIKEIMPKASRQYIGVKQKTGISLLESSVLFNGEKRELSVLGRNGVKGMQRRVDIDGTIIELSYGAKEITLPFSIQLDDFILDRYPGSMSPSSYESFVSVLDEKNNITMPFHIYMNHILLYEGFRFYQSSYDQDELGTILSVSKDPGIIPTYIGYFLMTIGLIWILFSKNGRFRKIANSINKNTTMSLIAAMTFVFAIPTLEASEVNLEHAQKFGKLLVQDVQGRIKPIDTLSMEIMSKIHKGYTYKGQNANQVILSMLTFPQTWQHEKIIKVSHPDINKLLGVPLEDKYVAFIDFFDKDRVYKLSEAAQEVSRKKPSEKTKFDKELLKVDERANVCYMVYRGDVFRIFPIMDSESTKWFSPLGAVETFDEFNLNVVQQLTANYLSSIAPSIAENSWSTADSALDGIKKYQQKNAAEIIPSSSIIEAELIFNKFNIFDRLASFYGIIGLLLMIILFTSIVKNRPASKIAVNIMFYLLVLGFFAHTAGLGLRWYIAGHAPWSNGYESLIYISWATILAGLFFSKKSSMTLAATSILAAFTLFVAHLSWMDPQITTLVPVLKSYWLTIHVSIISASYGFLALGALLGFITMILFIMRNKNKPNIDHTITELTKINELSIMIGIAMLSIGNLMGAIWANESWGRYWSWDAKETWTLISIMVYAFIIHARFIPKLKTAYMNAFLTTIAFSSIIMTYFGVNYYLSGLHSYAAGDPVPIPNFVYYTIVVVAIIAIISSAKRDSKMALSR